MRSDPRAVVRCRWIVDVAVFIVIANGLITLCGWIFHIELLKTLLSRSIAMKANTALCQVLAGSALWVLSRRTMSRGWRYVGFAAAAIVLIIGGATLIENLAGWDLHIDQLMFTEPPGADATSSPGRMGLPASASLSLAALALLLIDVQTRRGHRPSQYLALGVGMIALLSIIGYAYGIHSFYGIPEWTGIAAQTSLAFFSLSVGLLCARPDEGLMGIVTAEGAGGVMARALLLPAIVVPFALGWVATEAARYHSGDDSVIQPALILAMMAVFSALIWWNARALTLLDRERARVEAERRQTEELARQQHDEILHLSRVTTLGEMAAGLAHELNQPLGAILNCAGVALDTTQSDEQTPPVVVKALEQISTESARAGEIVKRLRDFVRKQRP